MRQIEHLKRKDCQLSPTENTNLKCKKKMIKSWSPELFLKHSLNLYGALSQVLYLKEKTS